LGRLNNMTAAIYAATALLLLWLTHRFVTRLSWPVAVVLLALPLAITGYAVFTGGVYGPVDHPYKSEPLAALKPLYGIDPVAHNPSVTDIYAQMFPWRRTVQASLERGEWPLWNPYMLCGHLLAAAAQSAPWSPFTLIACLLPAAVSFTYTASIALFIAALGAYLLARELDCGEPAALIGAAAWAFAASTVLYVLTPMGFTNVYEPLLFMATLRVVRRPGLASGALLTTTLVLLLVAGHPETMFLAVLAACALGLFSMVQLRTLARPALTALGSGALALLVSAIYLLPLFEGMAQSAELEIKTKYWALEPRSRPGGQVLAVIATDLFPYLHVRRWVDPPFGWPQAETAACGSVVLALAVYAIWRRRSPQTWFFLGLAVFCIAVESRWGPIVDVLQRIPVMNYTHHERLAFTAALSIAILGTLGADELLRRRDYRAGALTFAAVLIALAVGTWWLTGHVVLSIDPADWGLFTIFAELFFLGLAALLLVFRVPLRVVAPALLAVIVLQRVMSVGGTFKTFPAEAAYPRIEILEPLAKIREPFRIVGQSFALIPGTSAFYGLEDARGFEALTYMPFVHTWRLWCVHQPVFFNRVDDISVPFLSFLNVRYAVVSDMSTVPPGWTKVAQQRGAALLENSAVIERVFVPRRVKLGLPIERQVDEMAEARDFRDLAWITAPVAPYERTNGPGRLTLRERSPGGKYVLDADMAGDGWIVISDTAWNGWRAYIDGRRVETQRANGGFLSIYVPQGRHTLRIVYWPESFVRGRTVSFGTLGVIAIFAVVRYVRRRRLVAAGLLRGCASLGSLDT
jgi:hypothetical protein